MAGNPQSAVRNPQSVIRGATRLVGLIGWPVSHSLSPRLHNAAYAALGLDWAYVPLPTRPDRVGDAVRGLVALGFAGANVTVPHKEAVIPFLDELSPTARAIGAVNTIVVREDGLLFGDSTDGAGFMADLAGHGVLMELLPGLTEASKEMKAPTGLEPSGGSSPGPIKMRRSTLSEAERSRRGEAAISRKAASFDCGLTPSAQDAGLFSEQQQEQTNASGIQLLRVPQSLRFHALLLGAGGAARAIAYALLAAGATVAVVNRTVARGEELCRTLLRNLPDAAGRLSAHPWPDALPFLAVDADLIVNATSLGLHDGDPLPWDAAVPFRPGQVVYDTIYNRPTELLALAQQQGARAINGLGMLIEQAARSAALWTGYDATLFSEIMRKELLAS